MLLLIELVSDAIELLSLLIIVRAVLSWIPDVNYGHPVIRFIMQVTDPILQPIRRAIPPLGGFDVSPIVALLLVQFLGRVLIRVLAQLLYGSFGY